jgi:hypothetical protein
VCDCANHNWFPVEKLPNTYRETIQLGRAADRASRRSSVRCSLLLTESVGIQWGGMKESLAQLGSIFLRVVGDFTDRSASKRTDTSWGSGLWASAGVVVTAAAGYLDSAEKLFVGIFGDFMGTFRFLLVVVALLGCVGIVCSKRRIASSSAGSSISHQYSFTQPVRITAKFGIIALLVLLPTKVIAVKDDFIPLPPSFYGYLVDARSGQPVSDAGIRVMTHDGIDVTDGIWLSDSQGFYIVRTRDRVKRTAQLMVTIPECQTRQSLRLRRVDQIGSRNGFPMFRHHVIACGGSN